MSHEVTELKKSSHAHRGHAWIYIILSIYARYEVVHFLPSSGCDKSTFIFMNEGYLDY